MRAVLQEPAIIVKEQAVGQVASYEFASVAGGVNTDQAQFYLQAPADFDADSQNDGLYEPRYWVENLPFLQGHTWVSKLVVTPTSPANTALAGATAVPRLELETSNIAKGTYYDSVNKTLGYIQLQLQTISGALAWNQRNNADNNDPLLVVEFERRTGTSFTDAFPVGNSDHLWTFSQADLYVHYRDPSNPDNVSRMLIGWTKDEESKWSDYQETVQFDKGKPTGTAVKFMSKITASIKGSVYSFDKWFFSKALHITPTQNGNTTVYTEHNKQRPIEIYQYELEWTLSSGHVCRFIVPKGQVFFNAENSPGGTDITGYAFEISPLVRQNGDVCELHVSNYPVFRAVQVFNYIVT